MIANALVFLLGVLLASLVALLLAPVLWRKAQRFARREFEATIPVTANEIRAEFDSVRASAAMTVRSQEIATAEMRERMAGAQSGLGRANVEIATLRKRNKDLEAEMAAFTAERDNLRQTFAAHRDKENLLSETLEEAQRDGSLNAEELEALAVRFRELSEMAEERKIELIAAETKIERLGDTLRSLERAGAEKDTLIRLLRRDAERAADEKPRGVLRAGVMPGLIARVAEKILPDGAREPVNASVSGDHGDDGLREVLARARAASDPTDAEAADIRERIAMVAANVIHRTAAAEGDGSPLAPLLRPSPDGEQPLPDGSPSLADRVRRLAAGRDHAPPRAE